MSIDNYFELKELDRSKQIEDITSKFPPDLIEAARKRIEKIVTDYQGRDERVLKILASAAENKRFDEFAKKLEDYYENTNFQYVHVSSRRASRMPEVRKVNEFFLRCYEELGIEQTLKLQGAY